MIKNQIHEKGPIIYINSLEDAMKARDIGAFAVYLKRSRVLDIKLIMKVNTCCV